MESREWKLVGPAQDLLGLRDVAKYLGISAATLRGMIAKGEFPSGFTIGKRQVWTGATVAAWMELRGR